MGLDLRFELSCRNVAVSLLLHLDYPVEVLQCGLFLTESVVDIRSRHQSAGSLKVMERFGGESQCLLGVRSLLPVGKSARGQGHAHARGRVPTPFTSFDHLCGRPMIDTVFPEFLDRRVE